jgi:hypothetical protein
MEARNAVLATNPQLRLPRGWDERMSGSGHRYFVNIYTKITRWDYPTLPKGWEEVISDSGRPYYRAFDQQGEQVQQWEWPLEEYYEGTSDGAVVERKNSEESATAAEGQLELDKLEREQTDNLAKAIWWTRGLGLQNSTLEEAWDEQNVVSDDHWMALQKHYQKHRVATADAYELRDFSEGHTPLAAEWDKQVELVRKRHLKQWKMAQVIGIKEELDNAYLMSQFPVLQRLQYTKWPPKVLMQNIFIRFNLIQRAFVNQVQPSIGQAASLLGVYFGTALLLQCFWLLFEVPGDTEPAEEKQLNDLVWEISPLEVPMYWEMFVGAVIVEHICRLLHFMWWRRYFINTDVDLQNLRTHAERRDVVRRFHARGQRGLRNAIVYTFTSVAAAVMLAGVFPQKRAAASTQALIIQVVYGMLVYPACVAVGLGTVLSITMKKGVFDGLLSYFPSLIDFDWEGIASPPQLAKRFVLIEKEARILEIVYADGGIVDDPPKEPEPEA